MKSRIKFIDKRTIIIPVLIATVLFVLIGHTIFTSIREHYYEHMRDLSVNLAKGYSYSIQKSLDAEHLFNYLIEDKLLLASETTGMYTNIVDRASLISYTQTLRVDEINIFNDRGVLLLSTMPEGTEWKAFEGHPIYNFMLSSQQSMVESIRANQVTGIEYKYGYYKLDNGKIIQIGILASKINDLIGSMYTENALNDILNTNKSIDFACYIHGDMMVKKCVGDEQKEKDYENQISNDFLEASETLGFISQHDDSMYILYLPIIIEQNRMGTLVLYHLMNEQNQALTDFTNLGISVLIIMFILIAYIFIQSFYKSKQLSQIAFMDDLTQLPNDEYLQKSYTQFVEKYSQGKALIILNIDGFRAINVTYGYESGDKVLIEVARRLKNVLTQHLLYRWEGDRFVFLVDTENEHGVFDFANSILEQFHESFTFEEIKKRVRVKLGIVPLGEQRISLHQAIQNAMITLEHERINDKEIFVFNENVALSIVRENNIVKELQEIIEGNESHRFHLVFQPQLHLKSNKICGFEALARLDSNQYGVVGPPEFIDIAEKHHLIYDLGKVIFDQAFSSMNRLIELGYDDFKMAVNVSGIQLLHDQFVNDLVKLLNDHHLSGKYLEIEITESILMQDMHRINKILEQLRAYDITVSIDDFGTGYSSFFTISELNVDTIKINRSFIRQIYNQMDEQKMIAREIIQLAHKLGLNIVAEEVEYDKEYQYLLKYDCDIIQGYYFSRPLRLNHLINFLKT